MSTPEMRSQRFLRVAFSEKVYVSIIGDSDQREREEIEVHALNLSGSGIAVRCHRGAEFTCGVYCQLSISNPAFPGYNPSQGAATLKGKVARVFSEDNLPDWENLGIQFLFDSAPEESVKTHLIDTFCRQMAFGETLENQNILEFLTLMADLSSSLDVDAALSKIETSAAELVSSEVSSILLFDEEKLHLYFKRASGEKAPILGRIAVTGGIAWWVAHTGEPAIVKDVISDPRFTGTTDSVTGFKTQSLLAVPIILGGEILGVMEAVNKLGGGQFTELDLQLFTTLANQMAVVIRNARITENYENFFTNAIELIVKSIESVGMLVGLMSPGHCWRVAALATAIGQQFGISEVEFNDLYYGAVLHDIGLLESSNQKLFQFDYDEDSNYLPAERIKYHPTTGANMVKEIRLLRGAAPIIRHHHEFFDGTGYPDRLEGEHIPLGARIVAVVEAYEEMRHWSYTNEESKLADQEQALEEIKRAAGTKFDPQVVEVFINQINHS
ncbi:GAF domain-containing protein [Candidatus Poribacteria bacterium]|nr:GAF domain-containing protein [Candidatus Poribacteria bacterium]